MRKLSFIAMNLQLFAEDGGASGGVASPQGTEGSTSTASGEQTGGETGTTGDQGTPASGTEPATQSKQTPEQDAAFAQMRREAEQARREAQEAKQALEQRDKWVAEKFGKTHGIKTFDEYQAALAKEEQEAHEQAMRDQGVDPQLVKQMLQSDPEYQAIKQIAQNAQQQLAQQQGRAVMESQLKELSDLYPEIKSVDDVLKLPNYDAIHAKIKTGYSMLDAYESVNRKEIMSKQSEAAKQAALNNIQNKGHVRGNGQGTEIDTTSIPDDVLEMYKRFNPGKTMDEYKKHYKASMN